MKLLSKTVGPKEFIALMALLMSVVAISIDAMLPALGIIGQDLGATNPNQPQYILTFIFAGLTIGQLVCGPLSDAIGRKRLLYATIGFYLAGSFICLVAPSLQVMFFGRFLQGIGAAGPYVSVVSIIRDKFHGRQMARILSLVMMIFIMVPALAPSLGMAIIAIASWRTIFALYIIYSLTAVLWLSLRLEETLTPQHRIPFKVKNLLHGFGKVLHHRATLAYTICMGFVFGGLMGYLTSAQQIFQGQYQLGDYFALCFGGLALTFGASSMLNAKLVEKFGMRRLCRRSLTAIIIASALFFIITLFGTPPLWLFMLYAASIFFNFGMLFGNLNALAMEPMGHIAGLASSIIGAVSSLMSLIFGTLIGQMYNDTLLPLAIGFFIMGFGALLSFHMAKPRKVRN